MYPRAVCIEMFTDYSCRIINVICVCVCVCVLIKVCWQKNDMDGNINFSSVSSDGRVVTWQLVKNELQYQDTVQLTIPGGKVDGPEGIQEMAIS